MKPTLLAVLFLCLCAPLARAQQTPETATVAICAEQDLSAWLRTEEPYGTQGVFSTRYQRIQMHFATIERDPSDPCLYRVTGASRHRETVTPFKGTIRIEEARVLDRPTAEPDKGGRDLAYKGSYLLKEDSTHKYSGVFRGQVMFQLHQFADKTLLDDQIARMGPRYRNFTYEGTYAFYKGGKDQLASWGRGRLPVPEGVDVGKDRFQIDPKYVRGGWMRNLDGSYKDDVPRWWEGK